MSEAFWTCNVCNYIWMIWQVQSLYQYRHIFWMKEFNTEFLLTPKINIHISLLHRKRKEQNFTKTALHRLELCGVAWASGGRHSYSNSSLKSPEDLSNQKLSISRQEGVHNKAPSISIMLEARYSKSKSSLQINQSLHLLLPNWKRSSNQFENEISWPQVNKLSSSPSS